MGMCLSEFGRVSIEVRRESFIIHPNEEAWQPERIYADRDPHPEFYLADLDDLIRALQNARMYLRTR